MFNKTMTPIFIKNYDTNIPIGGIITNNIDLIQILEQSDTANNVTDLVNDRYDTKSVNLFTPIGFNIFPDPYITMVENGKPVFLSSPNLPEVNAPGMIIEAVSPYLYGFEGIYADSMPVNSTTDYTQANENVPMYYDAYNKGPRFKDMGLTVDDGWKSLLEKSIDGNIVKITKPDYVYPDGTTTTTGFRSVVFHTPYLISGNMVRFQAYIYVVNGTRMGLGTDAGYLGAADRNQFTIDLQQIKGIAPEDWYFLDVTIPLVRTVTSITNGAGFLLGFDETDTVEIYLATPTIHPVDQFNHQTSYTRSVISHLSNNVSSTRRGYMFDNVNSFRFLTTDKSVTYSISGIDTVNPQITINPTSVELNGYKSLLPLNTYVDDINEVGCILYKYVYGKGIVKEVIANDDSEIVDIPLDNNEIGLLYVQTYQDTDGIKAKYVVKIPRDDKEQILQKVDDNRYFLPKKYTITYEINKDTDRQIDLHVYGASEKMFTLHCEIEESVVANMDIALVPNYTTYTGQFTFASIIMSDTDGNHVGDVVGCAIGTKDYFYFDTLSGYEVNFGGHMGNYVLSTYTANKAVKAEQGDVASITTAFCRWNDTTTKWYKLGYLTVESTIGLTAKASLTRIK